MRVGARFLALALLGAPLSSTAAGFATESPDDLDAFLAARIGAGVSRAALGEGSSAGLSLGLQLGMALPVLRSILAVALDLASFQASGDESRIAVAPDGTSRRTTVSLSSASVAALLLARVSPGPVALTAAAGPALVIASVRSSGSGVPGARTLAPGLSAGVEVAYDLGPGETTLGARVLTARAAPGGGEQVNVGSYELCLGFRLRL